MASRQLEPAWKGQQGTRRVMTEFKYLTKQVKDGHLAQVFDLMTVGDDMHKWRFKLRDFDDDAPGGKQLNEDLKRLQRTHGLDHLLMEASFPQDYPTQPFFLRVIKPRCKWYTGHVTAGGSVCIESLTLSGTPGSWQPTFCVEAILTAVITNMLHTDVVIIRTATGPGGISGPLRVDFQGHPLMEYSEAEARAAFSRQQQHHRMHGWGNDPEDDEDEDHEDQQLDQGPSHRAAASRGAGGSTHTVASAKARLSRTPHPSAPGPSSRAPAPAPAQAPARAPAPAPAPPQVEVLDLTADDDAPDSSEPKPAVAPRTTSAATRVERRQKRAAAAAAAGGGATSNDATRSERKRPLPSGQPPHAGDGDGGAAPAAAVAGPSGSAPATGTLGKSPSSGNEPASKRHQQRPVPVTMEDDEVQVVRVQQRSGSAGAGSRRQPRQGPPAVELLDEDPDAAELEAMRRKLEALQQRLDQAQSHQGAVRAPLPSHWDPMSPAEESKVKFVELPLQGQAAASLRSRADQVSSSALEDMIANGISEEDAVAALLHAGDDLIAAYHFDMTRPGGAAAAFRNLEATCPEAKARRAALEADSRKVVQQWEQHFQHQSNKPVIVKIERIQNWRLWTKYSLRLREISDASGGDANETQLWHGSPTLDNISQIMKAGFDFRLSNLAGSLGTGTYFAAAATYSDQYSRGRAAAATAASTAAALAMQAVFANPLMPQNARGYAGVMPQATAAGHPNTNTTAGGHQYAGSYALLLCRVALGRIGRGQAGLRLPPANCDSVSSSGAKKPGQGEIFAVFDNAQAYPEYVIHYN